MAPFLGIVGDVVTPGRPPAGHGPHPGPRPDWDRRDRSESKSWSKSRGHKSHGKGRKHGKKDC